ncbi:MAG: phytanoyl-CoA dioxygenase family protein [Kordiimonadaceae bacterium]|nr:phytanoyl-CoA dioxygenase family protein [Kordiimonadaceae bacterium]
MTVNRLFSDFSDPQFQLAFPSDYTNASDWLDKAQELIGAKDIQRTAICIARAMLCNPTEEDRATAHILLQQNVPLLQALYERLSADSRTLETRDRLYVETPCKQLDTAVSDLKKYGIAVWPGMFKDWPRLEDAKTYGDALYTEHIARFGSPGAAADTHKIQAPTSVKSTKGNYIFTGEPDNTQGRYRASFPVGGEKINNPHIDDPFFDDRIREVAGRYYGAKIQETYLLFETLKPGTENQKLHIDGMSDQFKVLILLEDMSDENGPLVFEKGSHNTAPYMFDHFHAWFHKAADHPATNMETLEKAGIAEWVVTGEKGDCIFFDSHALHRGSPCIRGSRHNLVLTFSAYTLRSHVMQALDRGYLSEQALKRASSN